MMHSLQGNRKSEGMSIVKPLVSTECVTSGCFDSGLPTSGYCYLWAGTHPTGIVAILSEPNSSLMKGQSI